MKFFEMIIDCSWRTRLLLSGFFLGLSTFLLFFANRIWPWGWIVGIIILIIPFIFSDKGDFVEHSDDDEIEFEEIKKEVPIDELESFAISLAKRAEKGLDEDRALKLVRNILDQPPMLRKSYDYYIHYGGSSGSVQMMVELTEEKADFTFRIQEDVRGYV